MSETYFTPGPWTVYNENEGMDRAYQPFWCIANAAYHNGNGPDDDPVIQLEMYAGCEADAYLIAAALDLYRELARIVEDPDAQIGDEIRTAAVIALRKARGES